MKVLSSLLWLGAALTASTGAVPAQVCSNNIVTNGDFSSGLVPGSMPVGSVSNWSLITQSPQVVTDGCHAPGSIQMWGNRVVGESVKHQLTGPGFRAGSTITNGPFTRTTRIRRAGRRSVARTMAAVQDAAGARGGVRRVFPSRSAGS